MVGFYTDSLGRKRPITFKKRKRETIGENCIERKISFGPNDRFKSRLMVAKHFLGLVLSQIPLIRDLWAVYTVADSIFQNWEMIKSQFTGLKKESEIEPMKIVEKNVVSPALATTQKSTVWGIIKPFVPNELATKTQDVLDILFNKITDEELNFVNRYI